MKMNWFTGDVAGAIEAAKSSQSNLIVFTYSDDELSTFYQDFLDGLTILQSKAYVAIKIEAYTKPYDQLKAIYKIVPVPSITVIDGTNGIAIERLAGDYIDEEIVQELLDSIPDKVVVKEAAVNEELEATAPVSSSMNVEEKPPEVQQEISKPVQTKIQLKLRSGPSEVIVLAAESTLQNVRTQAANLFNFKGGVDLIVPYPVRTLGNDLDGESLTSLGLSPASTLMVVPRQEPNLLPWTYFSRIFAVLQPLLAYFQNIWGRLTGVPTPQPEPHPKRD